MTLRTGFILLTLFLSGTVHAVTPEEMESNMASGYCPSDTGNIRYDGLKKYQQECRSLCTSTSYSNMGCIECQNKAVKYQQLIAKYNSFLSRCRSAYKRY
ncbi:MAG: hypothetical protein VYA55_07195 [Pseudomonadota bacterium]|nr:hypothetical protein [Pseudomonadota bacterium]